MGGRERVIDVCQELGIGEAMFRRNRTAALQAAIDALEPKPAGRKAHVVTPEEERIAELEGEVEQLKLELLGARTREDLRRLELSGPSAEGPKKKNSAKKTRKRLARRKKR